MKEIYYFVMYYFDLLVNFISSFSLEKLTMEEIISWSILGMTTLVCFVVLGKIFIINILIERKKGLSRRFAAMEKIYNMGVVLVFVYAEAWYRYAKNTEKNAFEGDMKDMRETASNQIVSYLLGRSCINQKDQIKDIQVRSRATIMQSHVPLWANEIMKREELFKELILQLLAYEEYLAKFEKKGKYTPSENVDIGKEDQRRKIFKKYGAKNATMSLSKSRYKKLVKVFSEWDDNFIKLSDAEKLSRSEKNTLFFGDKK
ncbi:MAG: hypothetical protein CR972_03850 [Candidatus Moraniibacteriota bacterium]|nr:MAG: hypothetical protein CR972_03850 [Candidatus Moranbacteria bacterium]